MELPIVSTLTEEDAQKLCQDIMKAGEAWADADAGASSLEETKKTMLSKITSEYADGARLSGGKGMSKAEAEVRALADDRYSDHVALMVAARAHAHKCRVAYDIGRVYLDLVRSVHATKRAEMTLR